MGNGVAVASLVSVLWSFGWAEGPSDAENILVVCGFSTKLIKLLGRGRLWPKCACPKLISGRRTRAPRGDALKRKELVSRKGRDVGCSYHFAQLEGD